MWRRLGPVSALLALIAVLIGGWPRLAEETGGQVEAAVSNGTVAPKVRGCADLTSLEPVALYVRPDGGEAVWVGTGYRNEDGSRILVPARGVVRPLAPGPLGVHWEESSRTVSMLREGNVLSIHFPSDRNWSAVAILNGEAVGADTMLCGGRLYAPLPLLADGLNLRFRWRDSGSILVEGG